MKTTTLGTAEPLKAPLGTAALAPRRRQVLSPASQKVHAVRVAFCEAKRAAVECDVFDMGHWDQVQAALYAWIATERTGRETT